MKSSFADALQEKINQLNNPTVMGLDPKPELVPPALLSQCPSHDSFEFWGEAYWQLNQRLLQRMESIIPAVKFQFACYEAMGVPGLQALEKSIQCAQQLGYLTILDAKQNDIGSTATLYAQASIGKTPAALQGEITDCSSQSEEEFRAYLNADAVTVNGYLGEDGVKPFLEVCQTLGKGCFVLVRTSNPSAGDLQDLKLEDGRHVYEAMAHLVAKWGDTMDYESFSPLGAVVGATWPHQAQALRQIMPHNLFLIPGYGAQGGTAKDAVAGFDQKGQGGIVNASRSLMGAWKKSSRPADEFDLACYDEAMAMRTALREALDAHRD